MRLSLHELYSTLETFREGFKYAVFLFKSSHKDDPLIVESDTNHLEFVTGISFSEKNL